MKSQGIAYTLHCDICGKRETVLDVEDSSWLIFKPGNSNDDPEVSICKGCQPNISKVIDILVDKQSEINELLGGNDMIVASALMSLTMWNHCADVKKRIKEIASKHKKEGK